MTAHFVALHDARAFDIRHPPRLTLRGTFANARSADGRDDKVEAPATRSIILLEPTEILGVQRSSAGVLTSDRGAYRRHDVIDLLLPIS
jgi:hypothetical protein